MKVLILGSGLLGTLSAYYLGRAGHEVTVLDRQQKAAMECSFANGGQLSYSHAEPWANPHVFPKIFKWIGKDDAPLVFRPSTDPHMIRWGIAFLINCAPHIVKRNSETMLRLGMHSQRKMAEIRKDTGIDFDWQDKGILHIFSSEKDFDHACSQAAFQRELGCEENVLSWIECLKLEPSLAQTHEKFVGGIHAPGDESGDIHIFTQKLMQHCQAKYHTEFIFNVEIERLVREGREVTAVHTNKEAYTADAYVMCMGAYSPIYLRQIKLTAPIYPMKGYSLTLDIPENESANLPYLSVTDDARKIVYSRLGNKLRVAGTAEFAGYNHDINPARIKPIRKAVRTLFPNAPLEGATEWACLRPSTPDGPPLVGRTPVHNMFVNTGHGTLGWTQGAGTSNLLASIIDGSTPEISLSGMQYKRHIL